VTSLNLFVRCSLVLVRVMVFVSDPAARLWVQMFSGTMVFKIHIIIYPNTCILFNDPAPLHRTKPDYVLVLLAEFWGGLLEL
jgi:hypothetical protein